MAQQHGFVPQLSKLRNTYQILQTFAVFKMTLYIWYQARILADDSLRNM